MKTVMKILLSLATPFAGLAMFHLCTAPALAQSTITQFAGARDPVNGAQAVSVSFIAPQGVVSDRAGGFYFSTSSPQHSVYRVAADGTVTLIAGTGTMGYSGDGGPATSAQLNYPGGLALDASGNLLITDMYNHRIRKVTSGGAISTVVGTGEPGFSGDGGPATAARLAYPTFVALDCSGNLYISDTSNNRIRKVTTAGVISTVSGNGSSNYNGDNIPATSASLSVPMGIAFDSAGNLFIADSNNNRVRKITTAGIITTVAGTGAFGFNGDGPATSVRLGNPRGIAVDAGGNVLIADSNNSRIRSVTTGGNMSTVAGTGIFNFNGDGPATTTQLNFPSGLASDEGGNVLIADTGNNRIRKLSGGSVVTVGGNGTSGFRGDGALATSALLNAPMGMAVDAAGNLFIADSVNNRVRKVSAAGVITTFAGNGVSGSLGDNGPATSAQISQPGSVAVAPDGTVYITDCNNRVRKVNPDGVITTFATNSQWVFCSFDYYYYDQISRGGLALDSQGNLFVASTFSYRVYKITPSGGVSLFAGTGSFGFTGDGGPATSARIGEPWGIAVDSSDNLYIADSNNNRIRKVTTDGVITTIAGNGTAGFDGDAGPAISAELNFPTSVAFDSAGNLFISDATNYRIRKVGTDGTITTVAGNGSAGSGGDGGSPLSASLGYPTSIVLNANDNLLISDSSNHRIRRVDFALTIPTLISLSPASGGQGGTVNLVLQGTSFTTPMTIDAGSGITVSNIRVMSEIQAAATLTIASNANLGPHNVTVTTSLGTSGSIPFAVVLPFPDAAITSSHTGNLGVGFNETFVIGVSNVGTAPTTGSVTVTDILPTGLTYVSGTGIGWACSAANQVVSCLNADPLAPGTSTTLNLVVTVTNGAPSGVVHAPKVDVDGDLIPSNNTASDATTVVAVPTVLFSLSPVTPVAGTQGTATLSLSQAFPHDVTGTLRLDFSPNAINPADDPAIQFATGGRQVTFSIPANTTQARFGSSTVAGPVSFQAGTVAGTLSFNTTLQAGSIQTTNSVSRVISQQAPKIQSVQREGNDRAAFAEVVNLFATSRQVTQLILSFNTNPAVRASCGSVPGCTASGNSVTIDVKSMFDSWFTGTAAFGSISALRVPLSIGGSTQGTATISLRNSQGTSNSVTFPLP